MIATSLWLVMIMTVAVGSNESLGNWQALTGQASLHL